MKARSRDLLVATAALGFLTSGNVALAAEACTAYPQASSEKIESTDLEKTFGAVPAPKPNLRFAYVTKTLINEFWQDVAAGIKKEAGKYGITGRRPGGQGRSHPWSSSSISLKRCCPRSPTRCCFPRNPIPISCRSSRRPRLQTSRPSLSTMHGPKARAPMSVRTRWRSARRRRPSFTVSIPTVERSPRSRAQLARPMHVCGSRASRKSLPRYPNLTLIASQPGNWDRLTAMNATQQYPAAAARARRHLRQQ